MSIGKLSENPLKRAVINEINKKSGKSGTAYKATIGSDGAFLSDNTAAAVSCISGNEKNVTELAVYRACNSLSALGVKPLWITVSFAVPAAFEEPEIKKRTDEMLYASEKAGVKVLSGSTIVTDNKEFVVTVTALGNKAEDLKTDEFDKNNALILMLGETGNAGAAMLAAEKKDILSAKLPVSFIEKAEELFDESLAAHRTLELFDKLKGATLMHDAEDGGVFGALWELCERENVGCEINIMDVPIRQTTVEICEVLDINPYQMRGDGAMLAIVPDTPEAEELGTVIGRTAPGKDRVLINGEERRFLTPNRTDDYHSGKERS